MCFLLFIKYVALLYIECGALSTERVLCIMCSFGKRHVQDVECAR